MALSALCRSAKLLLLWRVRANRARRSSRASRTFSPRSERGGPTTRRCRFSVRRWRWHCCTAPCFHSARCSRRTWCLVVQPVCFLRIVKPGLFCSPSFFTHAFLGSHCPPPPFFFVCVRIRSLRALLFCIDLRSYEILLQRR